MPRSLPTKTASVPVSSTARRTPARAAALIKHLVAMLGIVLAVGCSGGGCSSCACAGLTPLPNGFAPAQRIENAGSVRLTDSGLAFLQSNLGPLASKLIGKGMSTGGVMQFQIPESKGTLSVCPGGPNPNAMPPQCVADIDLGNAKLALQTESPNKLHITGPLPIRVRDLPIAASFLTFSIVLDKNASGCPGDTQDFADVNLDVTITVSPDTDMTHSRYGYTKLAVDLQVNQDDLKNAIHACTSCPFFLKPLCDGAIDGILKLAFTTISGQLIGTLKKQVDGALCLKSNPMISPVCPTGTNDVSGVCRYGMAATDECASTLLGTDGHLNLGHLLASISPGTNGALDFLFAVGGADKRDDNSGMLWGDLNPIANGATLGMYGGAEASPLSKCVRMSDMKIPTGIPIPDELLGNSAKGWPASVPGPHLGIALSERFANYGLNSAYNSGLLCIGISTENIAALNSGVLGLLASSSKDLGLQRETQQVALVIRPSAAPTIVFGDGTDPVKDPTLRIGLKQASFDFYYFSVERFIRFMTATFDLDVPVNLVVTPMGLQPTISKLGVTNGTVINSDLLKENPTLLAASLGDLIAGQVGQLVGKGLKPISLNTLTKSLGLALTIPDSVAGQGSPGLRKLSKGTDNYLGIFAALALPGPPAAEVKTGAELIRKSVLPEGVRIGTIRPENAPSARLHFTSSADDGSRAIEYQWRLDDGFWHPFTSERIVDVQDGWLRTQGKHIVEVRSRIVGEPMSLDSTPAEVEIVIDVDPPVITLGTVEDGKVALTAKDAITADSQVRFKLDQLTFSDWQPASALTHLAVGEAAEITVEAKDDEGNVASASSPLIRGRAQVLPGGCGCTVAGADDAPRGAGWLFGIALAGVGARFGRAARRTAAKTAKKATSAGVRQALGAATMLAVASTWAGCNCATAPKAATGGTTSGGAGCKDCDVPLGVIGAYTSVAVAGSTVWVAGYAEADWDSGNTYGDLVVGKWNGTSVDWVAVDGVPTDPPVDPTVTNAKGFREGQTAAGDDVGTWTSIALDATQQPAVAYYDRTHKALKFAKFDGKAWTVSTVDQKAGSDTGRYAKMVAVGGGFAIAYQVVEAGGDKGAAIARVRVATSSSATPGATDWTLDDAVVDKSTPCRAALCGAGTVCVASTKLCTTPLADAKCNPVCATGTACIDTMGAGSCVATFDASKVDAYPDAAGDYIAVAVDPKGTIGIAYYDRPKGNLVMASHATGKWVTQILDGQDAMGNDTGDMGIGATLFIDASNDWHIAYVDGNAEALRYMKVTGGKTPNPSEVVDDGLGVSGAPFVDGQHLVGDDANITIASSGEVRVSYQDATSGKLHFAVGTPGASSHKWSVKAVEQPGFAGAFSHVIETDGKVELVNWWRTGGKAGVAANVAIVAP